MTPMIRKIKIIIIVSVALYQSMYGQKISNIDFDAIKLAIQDSSSIYYYPLLMERFQQLNSYRTEIEYMYMYYGNVYSDKYNPYGEISDSNEKKFRELFRQKKFDEAIPYGQEIIRKNPINLQILHYMLICHHEIGDKITAEKYANMYFPLLNVIKNSGDGNSINTAYVVIMVSDEYEILNSLGLTIKNRQTLYGQQTDVFKISSAGQKPSKGEKKIKELYFNVSKPLGSFQRKMNVNDSTSETGVSESIDTEEDIFMIVEDMPLFDGKAAEEGLREYVNENFIFPRELAESAPTGRIFVEFIIEKDGSVSNAKVIRGVEPLLDNEALRVINSSSSKWTPAKHRGKEVRIKFVFPVSFTPK